MKKVILFLCVVAVSAMVYSQDGDYDLSSYKTGDYKRKSLDLNFGSDGDFVNRTDYGKAQTFQGDLSLNYNQTKNNRKLYETMSFGISGGINYDRKDGNIWSSSNGSFYGNRYKENNSNYAIYFDRVGYHYINEKNTFIEFSPNAFLYKNNSNEKTYESYYESYNKIKNNNLQTSVSFKLGIGKGRLENVEDARQAIYILDELKEKGILLRSLTAEEINKMAAVMTRIKNKRQLDSRIRLIEEIETIDSLFVANGYIDKSNSVAYFTTLYDKWMYGNTPQRLAGSRFTVGLAPYYTFNRYNRENSQGNSTYDDKTINTLREGRVYIDYAYEKPVSLKFQNSIHVSATSAWGRYRLRESNHMQSEFSASYKWGYYPNTRTYAGVSFAQRLIWERYKSENNYLTSVTSLSANAYYYLSPQFRMFGDCDISYAFYRDMNMNKNNNDKHPRTAFSLGLTYSFF